MYFTRARLRVPAWEGQQQRQLFRVQIGRTGVFEIRRRRQCQHRCVRASGVVLIGPMLDGGGGGWDPASGADGVSWASRAESLRFGRRREARGVGGFRGWMGIHARGGRGG